MEEKQYVPEKKNAIVERYGLEAVPNELRTTSSLEYMIIQIAVSVNAGNFLVPALAVMEGGLSFFYAVLSTVIGATLAFICVSFLSIPGAKYGIPAQYAIRSILGEKGARYLSSPLRTITSLYWFAVQTIGGAYLLKEILERFTSITISFTVLALLLATIMSGLALVGFGAVKRLTKYFLPFLVLGGLIMLYIFFTNNQSLPFYELYSTGGSINIGSFIFFASLAFVQYIAMVSAASDITRYAKTTKHAFYGLLSGNVVGITLTAILGAYAAVLVGDWNPFIVSTQMTDSVMFITIIMIAALASMLSINFSNAYTGGYSLLNSFPKLGRIRSAVTFGIIAICLSTFPALVEEARIFISILGAVVIPLSAVIVFDFLFIKKCIISEFDFHQLKTSSYPINKKGLIAILLGICVYSLIPNTLSPGFVTFFFVGCSYIFLYKRELGFNKGKVS